MRSPIRPLPPIVRRWSLRARWLRALDGAVAWVIVSGVILALAARRDIGAAAVVGGVVTALLVVIPPLRRRWRPASALVALAVSWRIRPGDRAWYVSADGARLVLVTSRRWLHVVVAGVVQDSVEGVVLRRTRGFLVPANRS
jgi:hypothetical protein